MLLPVITNVVAQVQLIVLLLLLLLDDDMLDDDEKLLLLLDDDLLLLLLEKLLLLDDDEDDDDSELLLLDRLLELDELDDPAHVAPVKRVRIRTPNKGTFRLAGLLPPLVACT